MTALGRILTRLAVFGSGCLLCVIWLDIADARQAARSQRERAHRRRVAAVTTNRRWSATSRTSKWLANAHREKADALQRAEDALYRAMGKSIADGSNEMAELWNSYNSWEQGTGPGTARAAFEAARKYTGSIVVTFDQNTNLPDPEQLATARRRAACLRIAEGISFHEQRHTDVRAAGGGRYSRPSQLAREEADHYDAEAKFVQDGLDALRCPQAQASGPDTGERFAQRELLQRSVTRVTAYAASIS